MRLIDADELVARLNDLYEWCRDERRSGIEQAMCMVHEALTVDAEPVRHTEWISVKDRLPEDDGEYLVFWSFSIRGRSYRGVTCKQFDEYIGFYDEVDECGDVYRRESNDIVTHWMPLPEPPEGE